MSQSTDIFGTKDFENLLFNCTKVSADKNLLSVFPTLGKLETFRRDLSGLDKNKAIRYIIFAYDPKSPFVINYKSDEVRKKTLSGQYAGFETDPETGCFDAEVDSMMRCQNNDTNDCIVDFVRQFGHDYSVIIMGNEALYNKINQMNNLVKNDKRDALQIEQTRGVIWKQVLELRSDLEKLSEKVLNDNNPYLREHFFSVIDESERNRLSLTPERWIDEHEVPIPKG